MIIPGLPCIPYVTKREDGISVEALNAALNLIRTQRMEIVGFETREGKWAPITRQEAEEYRVEVFGAEFNLASISAESLAKAAFKYDEGHAIVGFSVQPGREVVAIIQIV